MSACFDDSVDMAEVLLTHGASVNISASDGTTALMVTYEKATST